MARCTDANWHEVWTALLNTRKSSGKEKESIRPPVYDYKAILKCHADLLEAVKQLPTPRGVTPVGAPEKQGGKWVLDKEGLFDFLVYHGDLHGVVDYVAEVAMQLEKEK